MRSSNTNSDRYRMSSDNTGSGSNAGVPPRTQTTTRPAVRRAAAASSRVGGGRAAGSSQCTDGSSRTMGTRAVGATQIPNTATGATPSRRVPPTSNRDALQAEMDALADDFYGGVASAAPQRAAVATMAGAPADDPFYKPPTKGDVSVAQLRSRTTWYDGPTDTEGRAFDASDRNLLCMDVFVPPGGAGGRHATTTAARRGISSLSSTSGSASLCVVGSADHGLKVFDLNSMREVKSLYTKTCGHTEWVTSCRFLSDRRVLSGGMDSKLCLWSDVTRGGPARCSDLLGHTGSISQVEVNESGGRAIAMSASYDRTIRLWELSSMGGGREIGCLAGHKGPVTQFSWCAKQVLSGDRQGTVKLWDAETAQCHLTASSKRGQIGALGHLIHPDVGHLVMFGDQSGVLTVLDTRTPPKTKPAFQEELHPGGMVTFIRAPAATVVSAPLIVTCGADKRIVARDARRNYAEVYVLRDHDDFVYSMEMIGNLLLTGAGNGRLLVHNVETGELHYELDANAAAVREIFASPDKLVAAGDDGKAKVFDFM
ncbi:hypothetical protein ABB37_02857 [Leptomonas pyrrhocoris]|uniref:Uncharacterized protein n=1 Tax=Leptomonas pyrrhocoris TaxID=157538 RepID=A0A0N0DXS9_LEPPY|nr:hypothetical protein ABB37_02857 [Leptomonas pyrrhocoris]KPA83162.1 hypothetical protein ABB37_02857 [Leptomonas pyrrhocoris]|eukprot:XP_015661601.1 hypothetical protein ABB37_02857 [Leptomonas pyrrhocoris]